VLMKLPYFLSVKTFYILHNKMKGYSGHLNWYIFFFIISVLWWWPLYIIVCYHSL
jgi:hypothetical protein